MPKMIPWNYDGVFPSGAYGEDKCITEAGRVIAIVKHTGDEEETIRTARLLAHARELRLAARDALSKIDDCADGRINFRSDFGDRLRVAIMDATQSARE